FFQSVVALSQPQRSLNSFSSFRFRPQIVCMTGSIGTSKNLPTFRKALLCVRPMNFWPTRQTLIDSLLIPLISGFVEAQCNQPIHCAKVGRYHLLFATINSLSGITVEPRE